MVLRRTSSRLASGSRTGIAALTLAVGAALLPWSGAARAEAGTVSVHLLPDPLREVWRRTRPEMNDASRCAAAFDPGDPDRMILQCSVYIRLAAEGERRALRYCEAKREELHIKGPCRIVTE